MQNDTFSEGIAPGGLRDKAQIKLLVCYLLKTLDKSLTRTQINEILQEYKIANYFEVNQALSELVSGGQVTAGVCDDGDEEITITGKSMIDVAKELKKRKANKVVVFSCFGLFTEGVDKFNKAYADGVIDAVFTTNLVYRRPELKDCAWYHEVDMSKFIALIIKRLNDEDSISDLLTPITRIEKILEKYRNNQ